MPQIAKRRRNAKLSPMRNVVAVERSGRASVSKVDSSLNVVVEVAIDAFDAMPATTLTLFAETYRLEHPEEDLFEHVLPGKFGTHLLRAPVQFDWDHNATMDPSDLDRLLAEYAKHHRSGIRRDVVAGAQGASKRITTEAALSEDEDEEELDEDEDNMDELSADEEEDVDENFDSDEDEGEECDEEAFCVE